SIKGRAPSRKKLSVVMLWRQQLLRLPVLDITLHAQAIEGCTSYAAVSKLMFRPTRSKGNGLGQDALAHRGWHARDLYDVHPERQVACLQRFKRR
ncbi:MAG: hypothetical protein P3W95_003720, partial [Tepidimonas taiwanensis]|nr:hypothetical protein [Tepidimonas taiwanensis]